MTNKVTNGGSFQNDFNSLPIANPGGFYSVVLRLSPAEVDSGTGTLFLILDFCDRNWTLGETKKAGMGSMGSLRTSLGVQGRKG